MLIFNYQPNRAWVMKFVLKEGQMLEDVFPTAARSKIFPPAGSTLKIKKLDARKFVGIIKLTDNALDAQRRMRNEWNENPD